MAKLVIDVSEHQKEIDWDAVKPHIDGAIIRCGYGDDDASQDDKYWKRNVEACERLGIPYGVYLYSYAGTESHVISEIAHVKRLLKGHKPSYPVYIDLEEPRYGSIARFAADMFCKAIEKDGFAAGVYTYESFYNQYMSGYVGHTLWVAKYKRIDDGQPGTKPSIGVKYDAWQYTSNGHVEGYGGRLDVSLFYRDFPVELGKPSTSQTSTAPDDGSTLKVLEVAASQIGVETGTKYGRWYERNVDKDTNNYDFGAYGVAWCAMFVSWVFDQAKAKCAGLPGAYCPSMVATARSAGKAVSVRDARPGDVVYFDWDGDGVADHVGIVESNRTGAGYLVTIEGNTDSGIVARKTRYYGSVEAVTRPDYGTITAAEPVTKKGKICWRLSTDPNGKEWLSHDGGGKRGEAIRWIAIKNVSKYRVFTRDGGWLPWVYKCKRSDLENGCAGDGSPITGIQVADDDAAYAVRVLNGSWYDEMHGLVDTGGTSDNFAGDLANRIDGFRIRRI